MVSRGMLTAIACFRSAETWSRIVVSDRCPPNSLALPKPPLPLPARVSLLNGLYPHNAGHGLWGNASAYYAPPETAPMPEPTTASSTDIASSASANHPGPAWADSRSCSACKSCLACCFNAEIRTVFPVPEGRA